MEKLEGVYMQPERLQGFRQPQPDVENQEQPEGALSTVSRYMGKGVRTITNDVAPSIHKSSEKLEETAKTHYWIVPCITLGLSIISNGSWLFNTCSGAYTESVGRKFISQDGSSQTKTIAALFALHTVKGLYQTYQCIRTGSFEHLLGALSDVTLVVRCTSILSDASIVKKDD